MEGKNETLPDFSPERHLKYEAFKTTVARPELNDGV
jgi:hypothetical protein